MRRRRFKTLKVFVSKMLVSHFNEWESVLIVIIQEKFQTRLQDMQKARAADGERQQAVVSAAVEKAVAEAGQAPASSPESADIAKAHADELRALEERLKAEHQKQLQAALEAAKKEAATGTQSGSDVDRKAEIAAAIEAHEKELEPRRQAEIKEAMDNGRKEAEMKGRIKDNQLLRAQTKLKEKEALILGWQNAGLVPKDTPKEATAPAKAAAAVPPVIGAASTATPSVSAASGTLPAKPGPATTTPGMTATPSAARGRGAPRGQARAVTRGASLRGAAPGRGGAPAAANAAAAASTSASGLSIAGAAGKRGREDGETVADDSLAKRLKPAPDNASKPVTLRRPPPTT